MKYNILLILALLSTQALVSASFHLMPLTTKPIHTITLHDGAYIVCCYKNNELHGAKTIQFTCQDTISQTTIGLIELYQKTTQLKIERIYIHKNFRGKGIGSLLISTALNYGTLTKKTTVTGDIWPLDEDEENLQALKTGQEKLIHFYQRCGAHIIEHGPYRCYPTLMRYSFVFHIQLDKTQA